MLVHIKIVVKVDNLKILKTLLNQSLEDSLEDSFNDSIYRPERQKDVIESESSESKNSDDIFKFDSDEEDIDKLKIFNPFIKPTAKTPDAKFAHSSLKTSSKSRTAESMFPPEDSPIKQVALARKELKCNHCEKVFQKNYNLKLHLISIHKIFPKGMSVFKCPVTGCSFVSGNRLLFN